ncbi:hypothetical protein NADFUDRAFT_50397 [Nadsonia fulvescens var. elongata DSM 6958]|uniref:Ribosomal protein S35, mitochondrial n=1 Tax=Nadsonia fulvescens var. elongata DSM 6958 TaxID=857566 RepID=A0A1E3PNN6_9ASCO|nr:hypothetical protein NADFUDRAFT_50397 [Nadsonia fulvescens var. elongata DSM 6958]
MASLSRNITLRSTLNTNSQSINYTQVRTAVKIAYPRNARFNFTKEEYRRNPSYLRLQLKEFLGRRNFKGEYLENRYAERATKHTPNYVRRRRDEYDPRSEAIKIKEGIQVRPNFERNTKDVPFLENPFTKCTPVLSHSVKNDIIKLVAGGMKPQEISIKYGIQVPRIEAVVTLAEIEKKFEVKSELKKDLETMSQQMYEMFPVIGFNRGDSGALTTSNDNLTEVPIPAETQSARFVTIAESEPFGPLDAANIYGIEPAAVTLEKLTTHENVAEEKESKQKIQNNDSKAIVTDARNSNKTSFTFKSAKVGQVGFRYGAARDDRKKHRKTVYEVDGTSHYSFQGR